MKEQLAESFVKDIVGYCNPLSVLPGQDVGFMLGAWNGEGAAEAEIVRLISGDDRPHGTGLIEKSVVSLENIFVKYQILTPGSYGVISDLPAVDVGELTFWFYPTLVRSSRQTLMRQDTLEVCMSDAGLHITSSQDEFYLSASLQERRWYELTLSFGPAPSLKIRSQPIGPGERESAAVVTAHKPLFMPGGDLLLAASAPGQSCFNGRLEGVVIKTSDSILLDLDFSEGISSQKLVDGSGNGHHGYLLQNPTRGVCGRLWDGSTQSYLQSPEQYAAVHFHEDDLTDAGWEESCRWTVPEDLPSGQYALKVTLRDCIDYIPFFVRAPKGRRKSLAYLVPTATYLAYANQRMAFSGGYFSDPVLHYANEAFLYAHEDVGFSLYEHHRDHSGVHVSSRLRPIMNLKPQNGTWAFNADTHITAWLDEIDQEFDVVTDEDLHLQGLDALDGYRTVITGTHPEYYSTRMRDALESWLGAGGRLMYMGGNGFYWRVAFQEDNPAVMEVRRAEDGTRAWIAEPGEYYHQFGGEYGGLWRRLGKPPNQLVGIGFAAQGFDGGTYYRVQPGALDPRVEFIVQGISDLTEGDTWGSFGNQGGGAAGEEVDRHDVTLGSPAHAVVIATSEDHRPGMLRVKEEFHMMEPLGNDPKVRADMVFFEVEGGGAVFSTGSISYAGSLAHNDYHNEIAMLTGNVLTRFLDPDPFTYPD